MNLQQRHLSKICCFGSGYVGTPTMAVLAMKNPDKKFFVYDVSRNLIEKWKTGCPIHENGLQDVLKLTRGINLFFTSELQQALEGTDVIYIAVPTPTKQDGQGKGQAYDMSYIETVCRTISRFYKNVELHKQIIIVEKSTVPVLTHKTVHEIIVANQTIPNNIDKFVIVSNPQFLAEGSTIKDLTNPDRIIFGSDRSDIIKLLAGLHAHVPTSRVITTSTISSQMSKLVANCFLAQRVSSINSISLLCQETGADIMEIQKCIGSDSRIGNKFLNSSVGFGGSCFKKDLSALIYLSENLGLSDVAEYWRQVIKMNESRKHHFFNLILKSMQHNLKNKKLCIFGLSFKKNTDDLRESSAIPICSKLLIEGAFVQIYDPLGNMDKFISEFEYQGLWKKQYQQRIKIGGTAREAVNESHAIIILTEWDVFAEYNYKEFYELMDKPSYIFDGRNMLRNQQLDKIGFKYFAIGLKS